MAGDDRRINGVNRVVAVHVERAADALMLFYLQRIKARVACAGDQRRAGDPERVACEHDAVVYGVGTTTIKRTGCLNGWDQRKTDNADRYFF